jgi:hypothetical protein
MGVGHDLGITSVSVFKPVIVIRSPDASNWNESPERLTTVGKAWLQTYGAEADGFAWGHTSKTGFLVMGSRSDCGQEYGLALGVNYLTTQGRMSLESSTAANLTEVVKPLEQYWHVGLTCWSCSSCSRTGSSTSCRR